MSAVAAPRQGIFNKLVGSISHYVSTPRRTTSREIGTSQARAMSLVTPVQASAPAPVAAAPPPSSSTPAAPPAERESSPPLPEEWYPGMIEPKYLSEMENMFDAVIKTPPRRPAGRPRSCPPRPRNTRANVRVQREKEALPRSAMKKRPASFEDEDFATPLPNKRVKFNKTLTQERILSPPHLGERECVPEHHSFCGRKRPRATDAYLGKEFSDSPNIFDQESPSKRARYETGDESTCDSETTPTTQNNTMVNAAADEADRFVPNRTQPRPGTFELNYDTYGLDDDASVLSEAEANQTAQADTTSDYNPPLPSTSPGHFTLDFPDEPALPETPTKSLPPKNPAPTPAQLPPSSIAGVAPTPAVAPEPSTTKSPPLSPTLPPAPPNAAAIDAEISTLPWPKPTSYVEAGIATQEIIDLVNQNYDQDDEYYAQLWWDREFSKFTKSLDTAGAEGRELAVEC